MIGLMDYIGIGVIIKGRMKEGRQAPCAPDVPLTCVYLSQDGDEGVEAKV